MNFTLDPDKSIVVTTVAEEESAPVLKSGRRNQTENELSDSLFEALNKVEQTWWELGKLPSIELLAEKCKLTREEAKHFWDYPQFLESLRKRGLDPDILLKKDDTLLPEQLIVANMVLNPHDKASIRQKLQIVGVKPHEYQAWLIDPAFQNYLRKRSEELFKAADTDAYMALIQAVQDGDIQAIKLFLEMRGIYNPKLTVEVNINQVLTRIVEIVSRHVSNPQEILAVAGDIEKLSSDVNKQAKVLNRG